MADSVCNIRLIWRSFRPHLSNWSAHAGSLANETAEDDIQMPRYGLGQYLLELHDHLDTTTLDATLGLMISECRAEIRKQRDLIALLRFDGQDTKAPVERLDELVALEERLLTAQERAPIAGKLGSEGGEALPANATVVQLRRC